MKTKLDPESERFLEYLQSAGQPVRVPEKSATDCTNQMIMLRLAALYVSPVPLLKGVGTAWKERRELMKGLTKDLAEIVPRLRKLKELQAELEVYYEGTGPGRLVENYEIPFKDKVGLIYDLEDLVNKFLEALCSSIMRLPKPAFEGQYVIYLMVAYYRKITGEPKRVFPREVAHLINEVGYYIEGGSSVLDQEGVRDAYRRFKKQRPILAARIDSEPMKYIQALLRLFPAF